MNAKPGWPVFATILCFCVIGALTLNSYQHQNGGVKSAFVSEANLQVAAVTTIDNDAVPGPATGTATAQRSEFVFPVVEVVGCSVEEQLAGTGAIDAPLMIQRQIVVDAKPVVAVDAKPAVDAKAIDSASQFAADLARTALMRGGFGFPRSSNSVEVIKWDNLVERPADEPVIAKKINNAGKDKSRTKLASFRFKRSTPATTLPSETWESTIERLRQIQRGLQTEAERVGTRIKAHYELQQLRSSLNRIGDRVRQTWVGEMIDRVIAPKIQSEFDIELDLSTYASI